MRLFSVVLTVVLLAGTSVSQDSEFSDSPLVLGLDHIPVAVRNLTAAAQRYHQLGFTLKPGRPHENGIRNQHIKFSDGTAIELITAAEARDALTTEYVRYLTRGDGPAFVSLYAPEMNRVANYLGAAGKSYRRDEGLVSFLETDDLRYIFFGQRKSSPTDRPEYFTHANGTEALIGVWIAGDDLAAERRLLAGLGATIADEEVYVPEAVQASVARLPFGKVTFLPGSHQLVPGRRIVGATLRVSDLRLLQRALKKTPWKVPPIVQTTHGSRIFLSPDIAHGIWLEFCEVH